MSGQKDKDPPVDLKNFNKFMESKKISLEDLYKKKKTTVVIKMAKV